MASKTAHSRVLGLGTLSAILLLVGSGCISNHDMSGLTDPTFAAIKAEFDGSGKKNAIYDGLCIPVIKSNLKMVWEKDTHLYPAGYAWADFESYGPLAAYSDLNVRVFNESGREYESAHVKEILWGLYSRRTSKILTTEGLRKRTVTNLLWILPFATIKYEAAGGS